MATAGITGRRASLGHGATSSAAPAEIGEVRSWTITPNLQAVDATSCDSSGWTEAIDGNRSWAFTCEAVYCSSEADQKLVRQALTGVTRRYFTWRPSTGKSALYRGWGWVTSFSVSGSHDGLVLQNFSIQGTGALNYTT